MTNKKNKLFTFFFSLIPGAGEMYLGFYKMGASVMILFFGDVALASSLFPPLLYLLPVMWFFSFFHTHNLNNMADEEFYALEDGYLFDMSPGQLLRAADRHRKPLALILIFMGLSVLWNHVWRFFWHLSDYFPLPAFLLIFLRSWIQSIPRLAAALLIIWIGVRLIRQKKDSLED